VDEVAVAPKTKEGVPEALVAIVEGTWRDLHPEAAERVPVALDSSLDRDLAFDSLARMELLLRVERAFHVDLPEDTLARAETVRDLLAALQRAAPHAAPREERAPVVRAPGARPTEPARLETATTLLAALDWHVRAHPRQTQIVCLLDDDAERALSYEELDAGARAVAAGLQRAGLAPRQTVAIMLPTSPEYFFTFFGVLMAGGIPVPIYPPARASQLEEHVRRHAGILANAQAALLVTVPEAMMVARLLRARLPQLRRVLAAGELAAGDGAFTPHAVRPEDIAFIQYTSGSTGNPKGVVLTHANLLANIRAMQQALAVTADDVFVSWLPLYHDMGLIGGVLGGMYVGLPLIAMSPLAFLARPQRWLRALHRWRGTLSAAPNFAYELCLRKLDDAALEGLDLSSWRLALNGAEPVRAETIERFAARFARYGLRREAILPVYGLAEASLGLAFPPPGRAPRIDRIRREPFLACGRAEPAAEGEAALRFVSCGAPLAGHAIRIVDDAGNELGERVEGRLEFKGPSATAGYFRNPEETARLFHDGWVDSGDRAYRADGEIYVTGRAKDIVIRGGRNIYPQEIEEAVGGVPGVRKGCVAVFGCPDPARGTERLVVLAETQVRDVAARARLREAIARAVIETLGEPADDIVLAPPRTVLKTSSGKLRRSACRALYEQRRIGARAAGAGAQWVRLAAAAAPLLATRAVGACARALYPPYALAAFFALALVTWVTTLFARTPAAAWRLGARAVHLLLRATATPFTVRGLEQLPERPCVLVCNHASYLDGLVLVGALPRPYAFVAKRELRDSFVARAYLTRLGAQFVERFDVKRSVDDANRMAEAVKGGRSLIVFPEGTFVARPGLLPFRLGAFLAAAGAEAPVVPVTIRGTRDVLPAGAWLPRRASIAVEIGAPLAPPPRAAADVFAAAVQLRSAARAGIAQRLEPAALQP
jgi:1-acyl-sn-glycerol-3-phosphate acyltransferase